MVCNFQDLVPKEILELLGRLNKSGYSAYLVGGCIRDFLLNKIPSDYDMASSAIPEEAKIILKDYKTVDTGIKHGTISVILNQYTVELTTFRTDGEYMDNRHPKKVIYIDSVEEDLARRDFTINAMAWNPENGLVDPYLGQEDLKKNIIRSVGSAEIRFQEDALRILRGIRFSSELGFCIEEQTSLAAHSKRELLRNVAMERIQSELRRILEGKYANSIVNQYLDVLSVFIKDISPLERKDVLDWEIGLAALLKNSPKNVIDSLRLDNATKKNVSIIINSDKPHDDYDIWQLQLQYGKKLSIKIASYHGLDMLKVSSICDRAPIKTIGELNIRGDTLAQMGYQGVEIHRTLEKISEAVLKKKCDNTKEGILFYLKTNNL